MHQQHNGRTVEEVCYNRRSISRNRASSKYKDRPFHLWDYNVKDKTVARPSYLYHGNPYTGKVTGFVILPFSCEIILNTMHMYKLFKILS